VPRVLISSQKPVCEIFVQMLDYENSECQVTWYKNAELLPDKMTLAALNAIERMLGYFL
jgi:hypothetical protein